jgi:PIN domain nuclease of toxin-antitoxin system
LKDSLLLDTCAWFDAFAASELLKSAVRKLLHEQRVIHLAAISLQEVNRKEAKGDLALGMPLDDWFKLALPEHRVVILPLTPSIAIDATRLPAWEHRDPADQMIVARRASTT